MAMDAPLPRDVVGSDRCTADIEMHERPFRDRAPAPGVWVLGARLVELLRGAR